jgi:hypothetical protein
MVKRKLLGILCLAVFSSSAVLTGIASAATTVEKKDKMAAHEIKKKDKQDFLKAHPDLANALKALKDLPKDQKKAKIAELKKKYPDFFKEYRNKMNNKGMKGDKGNKLAELAKTNPQLANELKALKDLPKEQRRAKIKEIRAKYLPAKK